MPDRIETGGVQWATVAKLYRPTWKYQASGNYQQFFKQSLGALVQEPTIKFSAMAGHHPLTIQLEAQVSTAQKPVTGDVVTLSQQGAGGAEQIVYAGTVGDIPEDLDVTVQHQIELMPFTVEMGVTPHVTNYTSSTDVAQMMRDAVSKCKHITVDTTTCPNTGRTGIYDFGFTGTALKVAEEGSKIAGANYVWIVDEVGRFWFGQANVAQATYTVHGGTDYVIRKFRAPIDKLFNYFGVIGGVPPGQTIAHPVAIACVYDDGVLYPCTDKTIPQPVNAPNSVYGTRARVPHFRVPKLKNQTTLNNITNTLGQTLNRRQSKIEITLLGYGQRINLSRVGGATMKYAEETMQRRTQSFVGEGYSPVYVISDVEITGPFQKVVLTDLLASGDQLQYELDRMNEETADQSSGSVTFDTVGSITAPMLYGGVDGPPVPTMPALFP
jgi:hypothetical protein